MKTFSVALCLVLFSFEGVADAINAEDIVELDTLHYEMMFAREVEHEIELITLLSNIDQLVMAGDIDKARERVFRRMSSSMAVIDELADKLSVENGRNEARYTIYQFQHYFTNEGLLELYPEDTNWSIKQAHRNLKAIDYPHVKPLNSGKIEQWHKAWYQKTSELLDKVSPQPSASE